MKNDANSYYNKIINTPYTRKCIQQLVDEFKNVSGKIFTNLANMFINQKESKNISKMIILGIKYNIEWDETILFQMFTMSNKIESVIYLFEIYKKNAIPLLFKLIYNRKNLLLERLGIAIQLLSKYIVKYTKEIAIYNKLINIIKDEIENFELNSSYEASILFKESVAYLVYHGIIPESEGKLKKIGFNYR